ncbi:hypothetical protein BPAE_0026g00620 [Botrytis paeoniae]|uniref:C2H2-type domain-containing protein n=1 Tax=Botrytis paeoniae TaxID=278948 RepID=A0A4Z1FZV0_9HELO|nr:hypothetical protein BPAE_0026g00620 [Botrytis paeoniae]
MNLSSLVHQRRNHQQQHFSHYNNTSEAMASSMVSNSYTVHPMAQHSSYTYVNAPQPPPSPPVDETSKCSLPSISSLLGLADGSSPTEQVQQQSSPQQAAFKEDYRPESGHQYGPSSAMSSRGALPPTPPMQSDGGFDGRQSPPQASSSSYSVVPAPNYYFNPSQVSAINNMEPHAQRQPVQTVTRRVSMPVSSMPYGHSPFNGSYTMSPGAQSLSSYYPSPIQTQSPQVSGLYYQRPLPQQFPPPMMPVSVTLTPSSGANPWQHHHYISPSSAASFPQSQDRYICQTCNKAFSRPSSLRIHSHSHTGEKPFKCPHQNCGKAFSVRSNMKRHERGCHSFESGSMI